MEDLGSWKKKKWSSNGVILWFFKTPIFFFWSVILMLKIFISSSILLLAFKFFLLSTSIFLKNKLILVFVTLCFNESVNNTSIYHLLISVISLLIQWVDVHIEDWTIKIVSSLWFPPDNLSTWILNYDKKPRFLLCRNLCWPWLRFLLDFFPLLSFLIFDVPIPLTGSCAVNIRTLFE